jgi:hypothetical protein
MPCGRERARRRRAVRCPRTAQRPIGSALSASCKACGSVIARDLGVVIVIGVVVSAGALVATLSVSDQQRAVAAQRDRGDPDTDHVEAERLDRAACHILSGGQRDARLAPLDLHRDVLVAESVAECERLGDEPLRWCRSVEAHDNGRTLRDDEALAVVVQNGAIGQVAAAPQRGGPTATSVPASVALRSRRLEASSRATESRSMRPAAKRPVARRAEDLPDGQHLLAHPRQLQAQQLRPGHAPGTKRTRRAAGALSTSARTTALAPFGSSAAPARSSGSAARRLIEPLGQPGRVTPRRDGRQRHEVVVVAQRARTARRPASGSQAHGVGAQLAPARRTWVVRTTGVVGEALPTSRIGQNAQRLRWGAGLAVRTAAQFFSW